MTIFYVFQLTFAKFYYFTQKFNDFFIMVDWQFELSIRMDNEEADQFYTSNSGKSFSDISRLFIGKYHLEEVKHDYFPRKF